MDVGNLLELQCSFQRDRVIVTAAQVDEIMRIGENFRQVADFGIQFQNPFHQLRYLLQVVQHGGI